VQSNLINKIQKIRSAFSKICKLPRALIKYGLFASLIIFIIGTVLVLLINTVLPYDSYFDMVSKELVKTSFTLAAESIIGGLIMDYVFSK